MGVRTWVSEWPVSRQLTGSDPLGRGRAAMSPRARRRRPRTDTAERVVSSICPYCAVECGQQIYVNGDKVVQIEGYPASPISRGRLCPKGSATLQLTTGSARRHEVLYRRPYDTEWEPLDLETAMDMVADGVVETRRRTWEWEKDGVRTARTLGIASLGGATLGNEENYLIKKLLTSLGVVQVESQARVCHSSTVAGLGTSFGRGGATTFMQDLQHADCIVIQGSNYAEAHPVGFQWVMEVKKRGARTRPPRGGARGNGRDRGGRGGRTTPGHGGRDLARRTRGLTHGDRSCPEPGGRRDRRAGRPPQPNGRRGGGLALLAGSACTRFGVFAAGIASAEDPKYTVVPQRKGE